jgi:hypothetical protein
MFATILSALSSKVAGPIATACAAVLLVICLSLWLTNHSLERQLVTATNTVSQLKGSLAFQNAQVSQLGAESAAAEARAKKLLAASQAAHAADEAKVAALLAMPVEHDPMKACNAADGLIFEFFSPESKGTT